MFLFICRSSSWTKTDQGEETNSESLLINIEITINPIGRNQHSISQNPLKKTHPHSPENIRSNETFANEETFIETSNFEKPLP